MVAIGTVPRPVHGLVLAGSAGQAAPVGRGIFLMSGVDGSLHHDDHMAVRIILEPADNKGAGISLIFGGDAIGENCPGRGLNLVDNVIGHSLESDAESCSHSFREAAAVSDVLLVLGFAGVDDLLLWSRSVHGGFPFVISSESIQAHLIMICKRGRSRCRRQRASSARRSAMRSAACGCAWVRAAADMVASVSGELSRRVRPSSNLLGVSRSCSESSAAAPGRHHGFGIARLVVVGGGGEGNQQCGLARGGKFRHGGRAAARHHQVRRGEARGHVVEEWLDLPAGCVGAAGCIGRQG